MALGGVPMPNAERTEGSLEIGRRYRFEHLALPLVLRDMYFSKDDPGPGDRVPDFDLPTLGGGRFRSTDLGDTGPALLVFGSYTCPRDRRRRPWAERAARALWRPCTFRDGRRP